MPTVQGLFLNMWLGGTLFVYKFELSKRANWILKDENLILAMGGHVLFMSSDCSITHNTAQKPKCKLFFKVAHF